MFLTCLDDERFAVLTDLRQKFCIDCLTQRQKKCLALTSVREQLRQRLMIGIRHVFPTDLLADNSSKNPQRRFLQKKLCDQNFSSDVVGQLTELHQAVSRNVAVAIHTDEPSSLQ